MYVIHNQQIYYLVTKRIQITNYYHYQTIIGTKILHLIDKNCIKTCKSHCFLIKATNNNFNNGIQYDT